MRVPVAGAQRGLILWCNHMLLIQRKISWIVSAVMDGVQQRPIPGRMGSSICTDRQMDDAVWNGFEEGQMMWFHDKTWKPSLGVGKVYIRLKVRLLQLRQRAFWIASWGDPDGRKSDEK
jgi:hypothetical protein